MTPDRQAALRDLLTAIRDALDIPTPVHPADDGQQLALMDARRVLVRGSLATLTSGALDHTAVQQEGRRLAAAIADFPVTYMAVPR